MSVIVRTPSGEIKVYCKGAVSIVVLYVSCKSAKKTLPSGTR